MIDCVPVCEVAFILLPYITKDLSILNGLNLFKILNGRNIKRQTMFDNRVPSNIMDT